MNKEISELAKSIDLKELEAMHKQYAYVLLNERVFSALVIQEAKEIIEQINNAGKPKE